MTSKLVDTHPTIAARLVDASVGTKYTAGSAETAQWHCSAHPASPFEQPIRAIVRGRGCPFCSGHRVLPGFNDLATTHPGLAPELIDAALASALSAGSNRTVEWACRDGHRWRTAVSNRTAKKPSGCPFCSGRRAVAGHGDLATLHPELAAELVDPSLARGLSPRSHQVLEWRCQAARCGAQYPASVANRTAKRPRGCPVCANRRVVPGVNDLATTHPELVERLFDKDDAARTIYGTGKNLLWRCPDHPAHPWSAAPRTAAKSRCGICAGKVVVPGINDLATMYPDLVAQLVDPSLATTVTAGSAVVVEWRCLVDPSVTWSAPVYTRTGNKAGAGCGHCFSTRPSQQEDALAAAIRALLPTTTVLRSDRSILAGRELDIVLPEHRLAIEFNGVYWHSEEAGTRRAYHRDKTLAAHEAGYRLVHVWEDDWRDKPELVLRAIAHRTGSTAALKAALPQIPAKACQQVYARKLMATEATTRDARAFLEANHLQGAAPCSRHFALRDADGEIRALLELRSPNSNARTRRGAGEWEIRRYATLGTVPGGFTKLLRHAERTFGEEGVELTSWMSFSADDVSDGGLYRSTGFIADKQLPPDYMYVGPKTNEVRTSKESFQRRRFRTDPALRWDESWTEAQAAQENSLRRIWDCGKTRWTLLVA